MSRLLTPESLLRAETQQLLKTYRTKEYALYPNWYSAYSLIRLTVMLLPQCKKDFSIKFLYIDFVSFFLIAESAERILSCSRFGIGSL